MRIVPSSSERYAFSLSFRSFFADLYFAIGDEIVVMPSYCEQFSSFVTEFFNSSVKKYSYNTKELHRLAAKMGVNCNAVAGIEFINKAEKLKPCKFRSRSRLISAVNNIRIYIDIYRGICELRFCLQEQKPVRLQRMFMMKQQLWRNMVLLRRHLFRLRHCRVILYNNRFLLIIALFRKRHG